MTMDSCNVLDVDDAHHSPVFIFVVVVFVRIIDILVRHSLGVTLIESVLGETAKMTLLDLTSFVQVFLRASHNVTVGFQLQIQIFACFRR